MTIYFKSFVRRNGDQLETTILDPAQGTHHTCQTLDEILANRTLKPNTKHHILNDRISVSVPTPAFPATYRPEGLLFSTEDKPNYCVPFDLMALTSGKTFTHQDYGSDFLPGHEQFIFPDYDSLVRNFPTATKALKELNMLREAHGLSSMNQTKAYNEFCFEKDIVIKPRALVGTSDEIKKLSENHELQRYSSIGEYLMATHQPLKYTLARARESLRLATPALVFAGIPTAATLALISGICISSKRPELIHKWRLDMPLGEVCFQK